jgi:hypothetical protein
MIAGLGQHVVTVLVAAMDEQVIQLFCYKLLIDVDFLSGDKIVWLTSSIILTNCAGCRNQGDHHKSSAAVAIIDEEHNRGYKCEHKKNLDLSFS